MWVGKKIITPNDCKKGVGGLNHEVKKKFKKSIYLYLK
jgi:hypothetical protein